MRIGLDLDGVVSDFNRGWLGLYNEDFGSRLRHEDLVTWNCLVDNTHFSTFDEFWGWITSKHPGLWATVPPIMDGLELAEALHEGGHDICIISDKPRWAWSDTLFWLGVHGVAAQEVYFLKDKYKIPCGAYIDDSDENIKNYLRYRPNSLVFQYNRGWNNHNPGAIVVDSWQEVMQHIEENS